MDSNQNVIDRRPANFISLLCVVSIVSGLVFFESMQASAAYSEPEFRSVQTEEDTKIKELRQQEITQIRIALGRRSPNNRRADLYLRLAEIYLEGYRATFILEGRVHEKRLEAGKSDKFIDRSASRPFLLSGVKACEDLLRLRIPYNKLDQVYYFLGFANAELDRTGQSVKYFKLLVQRFPSSAYSGEAYRELGDAAFQDALYRQALSYYEIAIKKESGDNRPRIFHKLAWCYYRTKQYERAVQSMKDAISHSKSNEKLVSVHEEALRDMAIFMTETGRVNEAIEYFQAIAGDKEFYPKALERLGKQYERNVEPAKAVQVYEALLKAHPNDEAAFRARVKLVDLDLRQTHFAAALKHLKGGKIYSSRRKRK